MNLQVIKNRVRKALAYTITGLTFLVIAFFLVLQIPAVQEYFIKRFLGNFSEVIGFKTTIGSFDLLWFDRLDLEGVTVYDPENNRMIAAESILINFKLEYLISQSDINIDGIALENAHVFLTRIAEDDTSTNLNINVFINRINENYGGSTAGGRSPRINIGEAVVSESSFSYVDQERDSVKTGFNYNHFTLDIDESQLQNFLILGDTTQFDVNTLLATDKDTRFSIKQLSTFFRLSQSSMEFLGLNMQAGESVISDTIIFKYNGQEQLSDFIPNVLIHANLHNTIIRPKDLALFAPQASKLTQPLYLSGVFNGRINRFKFTNMELGTGNTILRGSIDMDGLPDITETFIILGLRNSRLDFRDLSFLFDDQVLERLRPIGRVALEGEFLGYPTDFVAKGEFAGKLGRITSDINFKVNEKDFDRSVYSGKLALFDFDLGTYLKDTVNFHRVNLNGNVRGSGLTLKTADFQLNGKVSSIGFREYTYRNISTNARFASQLFNGFFKINDPNLQFSAEGSIDLREGYNVIKMKAQLDTANLHNLKLTKKATFLHANVDINTKGLHIDSLIGRADLHDFQVAYNGKWLKLDEIHLIAGKNHGERKLGLTTNLVDAEVKGDFLFSEITGDIQRLVREMRMNIRNDEKEIAAYYDGQITRPNTYVADFSVNIKEADPVFSLLNVDLMVSDRTNIEGKFTSGYTSILQLFTKVDTLRFNQSVMVHTEVEVTASKIADSTSVLAMAFVNSSKQSFAPNFQTQDLQAEAIWNKNHIDFSLDGDQDALTDNYLRLKGSVDFLRDSIQVRVLPSTLKVLEKIWTFDPNNMITIYDRNIRVNDLVMRNDGQYVAVDGLVSPDPADVLSLKIHRFDLATINPIIGREISGTLEADFDLTNYYDDPYVQNNLRIDSLTVDQFLIGDITGKNQWDTLQNKFLVNFFIDRQAKRTVDISGFYDPRDQESPLNIKASLQHANLKTLEPFLEDLFSDIGGTVSGDFSITGKMAAPDIEGEGEVFNGELLFTYLQTQYHFTGKVGLTSGSIYFKDIELQDIFNNRGKLNGAITHNNFNSMRINLDASFQTFQVLNTTPKDNSLFYGQAYATGDLNLFGPISNLKITANARTDRNTRIFIPIGGTSEVEKKEFIKFVSFTDSTFQQSLSDRINDKIKITGVSMDFNLDVTPDAYCEIIFDIKAGDIIRGRGNGDLQLQLNTNGEFNMFGPFEFTEGWYNFTLYDIINKDFVINKGSRINWYGDAYAGVLDISASYNQLASFGPILTDQSMANHPQMRRKYPVEVLLNLEGPMLTPDLKFDIVTRDLPQSIVIENKPPVRLDFEFQAFKNKMDEQELYRQVFSLIVLRRFSPPESFNTSGSFANSVSELFSNQLSNWISQVDENLEIDVDLSTFDDEAFNTFQLRLSYTFLNGRLRVTRDATTFYGNQNSTGVDAQQQNSLASIAGDWTVDYLLTADGKLKVKMYNRSNINPILNTIGGQSSLTTGVSISHMQSFNELKDLWRAARKRRESNREPDVDANEEAVQRKDDGS